MPITYFQVVGLCLVPEVSGIPFSEEKEKITKITTNINLFVSKYAHDILKLLL
jgi:hypothetical protein